jgi:flagellin
MGFSVNTNVSAINAYQNLEANRVSESNDIQMLSSGSRINKAADDAAGLVISDQLTSQINGYKQANTNAQQAVSLVQTAEGALNETTSILQRIRTLALEAANSTTDANGMTAIKAEVTQSLSELDQISSSTKYGTKGLFGTSTTAASFTFQVGAFSTASDQITMSISGADTVSLSMSGVDGLFTTTGFSAASVLASVDFAITTVDTLRGSLGAYQNRLQHAINNLNVGTQNLTAAESTIKDTDMAATYSDYTKEQILVQTSTSMLAQANSLPQAVLRLIQ